MIEQRLVVMLKDQNWSSAWFLWSSCSASPASWSWSTPIHGRAPSSPSPLSSSTYTVQFFRYGVWIKNDLTQILWLTSTKKFSLFRLVLVLLIFIETKIHKYLHLHISISKTFSVRYPWCRRQGPPALPTWEEFSVVKLWMESMPVAVTSSSLLY